MKIEICPETSCATIVTSICATVCVPALLYAMFKDVDYPQPEDAGRDYIHKDECERRVQVERSIKKAEKKILLEEIAAHTATKADNAKLREMLKELEWCGRLIPESCHCVVCGRIEGLGHTQKCRLAALLKERP